MNRHSGLRTARLVVWVGFAGIIAAFPVPAQAQTRPTTTLSCYTCQEIDHDSTYADTECVPSVAYGAEKDCNQYYSGNGWRCFLWGGACQQDASLQAVPLADFAESQVVGALVAVAMNDGSPPDVWELHGCHGALVAVYLQTPDDRFVRVGS